MCLHLSNFLCILYVSCRCTLSSRFDTSASIFCGHLSSTYLQSTLLFISVFQTRHTVSMVFEFINSISLLYLQMSNGLTTSLMFSWHSKRENTNKKQCWQSEMYIENRIFGEMEKFQTPETHLIHLYSFNYRLLQNINSQKLVKKII